MSLGMDTAKTVINSFVVSRIDYCSALLAGSPKCVLDLLQYVLNAAARLIIGGHKYDHVSSAMCNQLHSLRIEELIQYKLCLQVYKIINKTAPQYLSDMCTPVSVIDGRCRLRSAADSRLSVPRTNTKFGDRAFSVAKGLSSSWEQPACMVTSVLPHYWYHSKDNCRHEL